MYIYNYIYNMYIAQTNHFSGKLIWASQFCVMAVSSWQLRADVGGQLILCFEGFIDVHLRHLAKLPPVKPPNRETLDPYPDGVNHQEWELKVAAKPKENHPKIMFESGQ